MNKLKELRKSRRLTQWGLAKAADISAPYIHDIENGLCGCSEETLHKLANALKCDVEDIAEIRTQTRLIHARNAKCEIERRRKMMGYSQIRLAREIGVNPTTIHRIEHKPTTNVNILMKLANVFGCTIDDLIEKEAEEAANG